MGPSDQAHRHSWLYAASPPEILAGGPAILQDGRIGEPCALIRARGGKKARRTGL